MQYHFMEKKLCPALHRDKGRLPIASILLEKGIFYYIRTTFPPSALLRHIALGKTSLPDIEQKQGTVWP